MAASFRPQSLGRRYAFRSWSPGPCVARKAGRHDLAHTRGRGRGHRRGFCVDSPSCSPRQTWVAGLSSIRGGPSLHCLRGRAALPSTSRCSRRSWTEAALLSHPWQGYFSERWKLAGRTKNPGFRPFPRAVESRPSLTPFGRWKRCCLSVDARCPNRRPWTRTFRRHPLHQAHLGGQTLPSP